MTFGTFHRAGTIIQSRLAYKYGARSSGSGILYGVQRPEKRFDDKVIGARVKRARLKKKWSTETLATKTGIGVDSLYKKQRGETPFSFDELHRIGEALEAPRLFPILDWTVAHLVERLLPDEK